ncbi:MAG: serine/threonine protein kinase [Rhodanobacteraceae bacterium]|nr:serine/threonine protein kinase [Rhodanobacteraceae bacterium]
MVATCSPMPMRASSTRLRVCARCLRFCQGVQHAHQRGVIHRDLKPANILVDGDGRPKIMDFGIARVVNESSDAATRLTEAGQVVGTIPYMSPEQLRGESRKIDVRTDVFALGVILYELLSGKRPRNLDASSLFSAIKSAERKPMVPLAKIVPKFGGDLDTIVMKALADSPAQRYASVADFASDLERFLDDRPIEARAPSALYIAGKFARRHRALVTAASIAVVALIAATAFSLVSAQKEHEARSAAERSALIAESVNNFMDSMFAAALPQEALGREVSVREIVDQAARQLISNPPDDADVDARITHSLAQVYQVIGHYDEAKAMLDAGFQRFAKKRSIEPELMIELRMLDADLAGRKGDFKTYEIKAREALALAGEAVRQITLAVLQGVE